jgi:hypothetical protein
MPPFSRDAAPAEALSRYREALLRGAHAAELERLAAELDPDLVATLEWSLTTGRQARPQPDPRFVRDLRRELLQEFAPSTAAPRLVRPVVPGAVTDRRAAPPPTRLPAETTLQAPVTHRRWALSQLAAAAVLALMLVGGVLLVRQATIERPQTQLGATGQPTTETLVDATITNAAATWTPLAVERWRFQPSATLTIPSLDGPQWIVADTGPLVATVDGEAQSLAPGASLVVPAGKALTLRNPELAEAAALRGVASSGFALEEYDRSLVTKELALDTEAHEALPPGASHIVFDRLSIPPGTTLRAEAATGQDWFDVVTGQLGLTLIGDALPQGWQSGQERELTLQESIPILIPGTHVSLHNIGQDPLVLLRLRVSPQSSAGSPEADIGPAG